MSAIIWNKEIFMTLKHIHFKTLFLVWCLIFIGLNAYQLIKKLSPQRPIAFAGLKFSGLNDYLKEETHVGYTTDRNLNDTAPLAEYEQAQYVLAPLILDVTDTYHPYVLINCSTDTAALDKLKALNAKPLLRNQFGIILAQRIKQP